MINILNKINVTLGILVFCIYANLISGIEKFNYVIIFFVFFLLIIADIKENLQLLFFLIPSLYYFTTIGFDGNPVTYYALGIAGKYFIISTRRQYKSTNLLLAGLIIFLELSHIFITNFNNIGEHLRWSILFFFTILLMSEKVCMHSFSEFINYFLVGYFASAILGVIGFLFSDNYPSNPDLVKRFSGLSGDPNTFGLYSLLAISFLLPKLANTKNKVINIIYLIAVFYFAFLTVSRTFLLCVVLLLIIFFLTRGFSKNIFFMFTGFILVLVSIIIIGDGSSLVQNYTSRMDHADLNGFTGSRSSVFVEYINGFLTLSGFEMIFGVGINNYLEYFFNEVYSFNKYKQFTDLIGPHNAILEIVISFGIFGSLIFINLISRCLNFKFSIAWFRRNVDNILPLVALISYAVALQYFGQYSFYFILFLVSLYIKEKTFNYGSK